MGICLHRNPFYYSCNLSVDLKSYQNKKIFFKVLGEKKKKSPNTKTFLPLKKKAAAWFELRSDIPDVLSSKFNVWLQKYLTSSV